MKTYKILLLGTLSMFISEVLSGSSQMWFIDFWGIFTTFPLYLSHILFLLSIALLFKKISIHQLYLFGIFFALYEAWFTKVLWAGYLGLESSEVITLGGIAIMEFLMLVFFWHPVMSFVLPVLIFQILNKNVYKTHSEIIQISKTKTICLSVLSILLGAFTISGNAFNLISANLSIFGTVVIIYILYKLSNRDNLNFVKSKIIMIISLLYIIILYLFSFFKILPEKIPASFSSYAIIILTYIVAIYFISISKKTEMETISIDEKHYSIKHLNGFLLLIIISLNISSVSTLVTQIIINFSYLILIVVGIKFFVSSTIEVLSSKSFSLLK